MGDNPMFKPFGKTKEMVDSADADVFVVNAARRSGNTG